MKISDLNFDSAGTVTKRCVTFARDGNKVVKPYKKLYSLATLMNNQEVGGLFLEKIRREFCTEYEVWEQLTDFCISIGSVQEDSTVEKLIEGLSKYKFLGIEGFLNFLEGKEKFGDYINLLEIEVCRMLNRGELVAHYTEYRNAFIQKRKEREAKERVEKEQREQEKEAAERERQLREAENLIRNHQTLYNEQLPEGSSVVLTLMKRHGVKVPLRTQGWINKALHSIHFNRGKISYDYYSTSSDSKVFKQYLLTLIEKIGNKREDCHAD